MEIFEDTVWRMSIGERAALEGLLSQSKPALAIEIGTAQGASLTRISEHAGEVHSFDLAAPSLELPRNVTLHTGDSHQLLPELLAELAEQGRNVDFVLVDGDHSAGGVQRDIEDLLNSDAVQQTIIVAHDTANEEVRRGLDAVRYDAWPKVSFVDLDCVSGFLFREERIRHELWGGLAIIVVDATRTAYGSESVMQQRFYPAAPILAEMRDVIAARERSEAARRNGGVDELIERVTTLEQRLAEAEDVAGRERQARLGLERSFSWQVTRPLRRAKSRARRAVT